MGGDPSRRNQNLYCTYHRDKGHTTEQCCVLKDHLGQLVKAGHLKDFVLDSGDRITGQDTRQRGNPLPPLVGVIEVIHVALEKLVAGRKKGVLTVVPVECNLDLQLPGKKMKFAQELMSFNDDDLEGTIQPYDDALVVMARINGFLVKRVMVDQGSGVDVMYPDMFRGLRLRKEDLMKHTSPLVGFDGKVVIPEGQISLPVIMGGGEGGGNNIYTSNFIFLVYGHSGKTMDPFNGGCPVYPVCKDQVPNRAGHCHDKGRPARGNSVLLL